MAGEGFDEFFSEIGDDRFLEDVFVAAVNVVDINFPGSNIPAAGVVSKVAWWNLGREEGVLQFYDALFHFSRADRRRHGVDHSKVGNLLATRTKLLCGLERDNPAVTPAGKKVGFWNLVRQQFLDVILGHVLDKHVAFAVLQQPARDESIAGLIVTEVADEITVPHDVAGRWMEQEQGRSVAGRLEWDHAAHSLFSLSSY